MDKVKLGRSELEVSPIAFGTWQLGGDWGATDEQAAIAAMGRAADLGIKKAGARIGLGSSPRAIAEHATAWRPWRTYATHQLWATLADH